MKPIKLTIKTKTQLYPIIIGTNLISNISKGGHLIVPANNENHLSYWKKLEET